MSRSRRRRPPVTLRPNRRSRRICWTRSAVRWKSIDQPVAAVARMSEATSGSDGNPGCRFAHPGYGLTSAFHPQPERAPMDGVTIVTHPLVQHKLTLIRDKSRSTKGFRELLNEIGMLLCYEVTRDLPLTDVEIETPLTRMTGKEIAGKKLVFAPILRAGLSFLEGMIDLVPSARIAHIGLYRDPDTFVAVEYFFKAPANLDERLVIVIDPMLATANTAVAAIDRIKERGAKDIRFVCL